MTTAQNGQLADGHLEFEGSNEFANYQPPDLSNFNELGEPVTGRGPGGSSDSEFYAYSTILAEGLKPQSDTEIEFIKTAALRDPRQQACLIKHLNWFNTVYNAPVTNRYGLIESTRRRTQEIVEDAEDEPDEDVRQKHVDDIAQAVERAEDYHRSKARATHLLSLPTTGMARAAISSRRFDWERTQETMQGIDGKATSLYSGAREVYHHRLYILWVEGWIAEDERKGLPVAQYDYTELKRKFREKTSTPMNEFSRMPMPWQVIYQMCMASLSTGDEWRQMFVTAITRGIGQMPPSDPPKKKRWWDRIGRRNPSQNSAANSPVSGMR